MLELQIECLYDVKMLDRSSRMIKLSLRLLTIFCYFLPFTFFLIQCKNPLDCTFSYNQSEADSNLKESQPIEINSDSTLDVSDRSIVRESSPDSTSALVESSNVLFEISRRIIMPTSKSLSGIGAIFISKIY